MEKCLAKDSELGGIGCDNMTVIIVGFLNGKNEKDWYDWMIPRYGTVGPEYEESENRQQKGDDLDYNDDDEDEGLEIPADTNTDEYVTDDTDLENQNELTIDDIPTQRRDSSSSFSSVESGNSSRSNSTDSVSKEKSEAIDSPISNPPQSPHGAKSLNYNADDKSTTNESGVPLSPGGKAGNKIYDSTTWPLSKKDQGRLQ